MDNDNDKIYQLARVQVDMVKSALGKRFTFEDNNTNEPQELRLIRKPRNNDVEFFVV
jgi:hypothetical protein